ncbi:hypothetical protein AB4097_14800 [Microvirga sp. 2MCAF35]|uniref:hypothetical protein n=1 Tax=Microvirga sp. 2MCAF35 TaxID=3232987 RepID=UPI003F96D016
MRSRFRFIDLLDAFQLKCSGPVIPVSDASAFNDNDEALAYRRIVVSGSEASTQAQHSRRGKVDITLPAQPHSRRFVGKPLIVGIAVSITVPSP